MAQPHETGMAGLEGLDGRIASQRPEDDGATRTATMARLSETGMAGLEGLDGRVA